MSSELVYKNTVIKKQLVGELGLSEELEVQREQIATLRAGLLEAGYPYWRKPNAGKPIYHNQ